MKREILIHPDPRLRTVCTPVEHVDDRVQTLAAEMIDALATTADVGLAANQIGATDRVIVYDTNRGEQGADWRVLVNPRIVARSGERMSQRERCASLPGLRLHIPRADRIQVAALSLTGQPVSFHADGFESAVIQRAIDHLDGKLIIDRVAQSQRAAALRYADNLARMHARLSPLRARSDGVLSFEVAPHNGVVVLKDADQILLYFVDRWRVSDPQAIANGIRRNEKLRLSGVMSRIDLLDPVNLLGVYTQAMMLTLAWAPNPRRVYMLGFGGGRIPAVFRHYFPDVVVDGSELDGEVLAVAEEFFAIDFDEKMRVFVGDGREHLASMSPGTSFDILLVDCYSGTGRHPEELSTPEFYALCKSRLARGGVIASNLIESDPNYARKARWFYESFANAHDFAHEGTHVLFGTDGEPITCEELVARTNALDEEYVFGFPLTLRAESLRRLDRPSAESDSTPTAVHAPATGRIPASRSAGITLRPQPAKVSRNDPCPCGSGKKYKKCCLRKK